MTGDSGSGPGSDAGSGRDDGGTGPDRDGDTPLDIDSAFAAIVAGWATEAPDGRGTWPAAEDVDLTDAPEQEDRPGPGRRRGDTDLFQDPDREPGRREAREPRRDVLPEHRPEVRPDQPDVPPRRGAHRADPEPAGAAGPVVPDPVVPGPDAPRPGGPGTAPDADRPAESRRERRYRRRDDEEPEAPAEEIPAFGIGSPEILLPQIGAGAGPRDSVLREPEEGYVPPEPPPILTGDPVIRLLWAAALGGPLFLLLATIVWRSAPQILVLAAVAAFIGGFVGLVVRMPRDRDDDDDDGAVV